MMRISTQELPTNLFPSSANEIRLQQCNVKMIRKNAFVSLEVYVKIEDSRFGVIESEAFSDKSLIWELQLKNVTISQLHTGAILSAVQNLTISDST